MRRPPLDRWRWSAAVAVLVLAAAVQPARAQGEPEGRQEAVVPPGQDDLLATMAGRGLLLPDYCRFTGGGADGPLVRVAYACPAGEVVYDLVHPSVAPEGAAETDRFALTLRSGNPPETLTRALLLLIRSNESRFRWSVQTVADGTGTDASP